MKFKSIALLILISIFSSGCFETNSISTTSVDDGEKQTSKYDYRDIGDNFDTYYLNSTGEQKILVIPVVVKENFPKVSPTSENKAKIEKAFFGKSSDTSWESVASYYNKSSYGKLNLTGTVTDWYNSNMTPSQIYAQNDSSFNDGGTFTILDNAIAWYKLTYNTTGNEFDVDKDGYLDAVWLIYSCDDGVECGSTSSDNPFWAFTFWNYNNYGKGNIFSPVSYTYAWASFNFLKEGYGSNGIDSHTYIHETGHMMGADDYYDYDGGAAPAGYLDMMDGNILDHNVYTKFAYNWVNPYFVSESKTLTISSFEESGDCIIIANNWNGSAFDEYIMVELYTPTGLNYADSHTQYPSRPLGFSNVGVKITHVDARLIKCKSSNGSWITDGYSDTIISTSTSYVKIAASNTPSRSENENFRLLTIINKDQSTETLTSSMGYAKNSSLFYKNDSFSMQKYSSFFNSSKLNCGELFPFTISIDELSSTSATISISK